MVLAETMYSDEAVPSIVTMMRVNGTEDKFKDRADLKKATGVRKIINHQHFCHHCYESDARPDMIECSSCPRAFHPKCLGFKNAKEGRTLSGQFRCPEHRCMECDRTASYVGGTFPFIFPLSNTQD
jgi:hypothetical protein